MSIKIVLDLFGLSFSTSEFVLPIFDLTLAGLQIILQFGHYLLILLYFDFIVFVFVDKRMQFNLLSL